MFTKLENKVANALLRIFATDNPARNRWSNAEQIIAGAQETVSILARR